MSWIDALCDWIESKRDRRPVTPRELLTHVRLTNMQRVAVIREIDKLRWEMGRTHGRGVSHITAFNEYEFRVACSLREEAD